MSAFFPFLPLPLLLLLLLLPSLCSPNKILVYNVKFAHSHGNYMGSLADLLAEEGYDVTTLIPELDTSLKDGTTKTKVIRIPPEPRAERVMKSLLSESVNMFETKIMDLGMALFVGPAFGGAFAHQCNATIHHPGLLDQLAAEHFDVMLTENFDCCGMGLSHLIKPRAVIKVSTSVLYGHQYDDIGVPTSLSFNPSTYTSHLDPKSIISRAWNLFGDFASRTMFNAFRDATHEVFRRKYGEDFPTWAELTSHIAYAFTNAEPLIDFAHPTLHRVIPIGGLGAKEPQALDEHWSSVLSLRPHNVIISFGSLAHSVRLAVSKKRALLEMFRAFPDVTFIWKYEDPSDSFSSEEASKVSNVVLSKWFPQNDLLAHSNMSVFISHGGMGSVQETTLRGVPAMFVPLFGDQPRNSAAMAHNGLGKVFDKFDLGNADRLIASLGEILHDERFASKAKATARMLSRKPFTSKETLLRYISFAAEFGPSPALRPASVDMSLLAYHNIDIILIGLVVLSAVSSLSLLVVSSVISRFIRAAPAKKKTS